MTLFDKDKVLNSLGKAMDKVNETADKATQYAKDREWDKKAEDMKDKTVNFVKDHEIDKAAQTVAGVVGSGLKAAGNEIEKAGANLERTMKEKKASREHNAWADSYQTSKTYEENPWRPAEDETVNDEAANDETVNDEAANGEAMNNEAVEDKE